MPGGLAPFTRRGETAASFGETMKVAIADIQIRDRFRRDMGDLPALAKSIEQEGLLQPIGITEGNRLVFGERRLSACRDILGRKEIEARVVKVSSIIAGEYAENEMRKDFTPSERVAIAEAIRREMAGRQGSRTDLQHKDRGPEVARGQTRDIAAKQVGFGSGKQLERAEKVVRLGVPALVEKMDLGEVSIGAAEVLARKVPEVQAAVIAMPDAERREALKDLRDEKDRVRALADKFEAEKGSTHFTAFLRKHGRYPTPDEAKALAKIDNKATPDDRGKHHSPAPAPSKAEKAAKKQDDAVRDEAYRFVQAVQLLAWNSLAPTEVVAKIYPWEMKGVQEQVASAKAWLDAMAKELDADE